MSRLTAFVVLAVIAGVLAPAVPAGAADGGAQGGAPASAGTSDGASAMSRGVIVKVAPTQSSSSLASAARDALAAAGLDRVRIASTRRMAVPGTRLLLFDAPLPERQAEAVAAALEGQPGVVWAEADALAFPAAEPAAAPVIPNDARFAEQWDLWAGGGPTDFGVQAPLAWSVTRGSASVVVAVIDTGSTVHPDLEGSTVPGYDFISSAIKAGDFDERDPDPSDTGDFLTDAEVAPGGAFEGCNSSRAKASSWHGTHVAGTINAVQGNGVGVSGIAPLVKVQHLRTLGKCGGWGSDIADAIVWASGGEVTGLPGNATPAQVINMSLGGRGPCPAVYQDAIDEALGRGVTIVVAAGNDNRPVSDHRPANCSGVITVAATDRSGLRSRWSALAASNYGTSEGEITLSAPGTGVLSTVNTGLQGPDAPDYRTKNGTSMATPHVAAGAALLYSAGVTGPDLVRERLMAAVTTFPAGSGEFACTIEACGAGILNLGLLEFDAPRGAPAEPTDVTHTLLSDTSLTLEWQPPVDDGGSPITVYRVEQRVGASEFQWISTTPFTSLDVTDLASHAQHYFRVAAVNDAGVTGPWSAVYGPVTPVELVPPGQPTDLSHAKVSDSSLTLEWQPPADDGGGGLVYEVEQQVGLSGFDLVSITPTTSVTLENLVPSGSYLFRVRAKNDSGPGEWSQEYGPVTLEELTKPGVPTDLVHVKTSETSLTLEWQAPEELGGGSPLYEIQQKVGLGAFITRALTPLTSFDVEGLAPSSSYMFRVRAKNGAAVGDWTAPYGPVVLQSSTPPGEPTQVTASLATPTSLTVTWRPPADPGTGALSYVVQYSADGLYLQHAITTSTSATIEGLTRGLTYSVRVAARNSSGSSAWVYSGMVALPQIEPPRAVSLASITHQLRKSGQRFRGTLRWAPAEGTVTSYRVRMRVGSQPWSAWSVFTPPSIDLTSPKLLLRQLARSTRYTFAIVAANDAGRSSATIYSFTTPRR